jgi:hypothetical protein
MKKSRKMVSSLLIAAGIIAIVISALCFWNAYKIRQQLLGMADDDPFAMVFTTKIEPEVQGGKPNEIIILNNRRIRNENRGWWLIISGSLMTLAGAGIRKERESIKTLGIAVNK